MRLANFLNVLAWAVNEKSVFVVHGYASHKTTCLHQELIRSFSMHVSPGFILYTEHVSTPVTYMLVLGLYFTMNVSTPVTQLQTNKTIVTVLLKIVRNG